MVLILKVATRTRSEYSLPALRLPSHPPHVRRPCRYWVFRSWGRVGTTIGGNKLDKFHDKNSAMDNFLGVYKEKTGNNWSSSNFTKYPNKFYPLEIDYGQVRLGPALVSLCFAYAFFLCLISFCGYCAG